MDVVIALAAAGALSLAHIAAPMMSFVRLEPRSRVLSLFGGVSVAYVFVHLLPEVAAAQQAVDERAEGFLPGLERHAYLIALLGLVVFYALERASLDPSRRDGSGTFWVATASFATYNAVVGYLVARRAVDGPTLELVLFTVALSVHFIVNDLALRHHHADRYDRMGRPLLVVAVLVGAAVGTAVEISPAALGLAVAFLAGGIVLNVLKEELPEERASRLGPFVLGAAGYAGLLLLI